MFKVEDFLFYLVYGMGYHLAETILFLHQRCYLFLKDFVILATNMFQSFLNRPVDSLLLYYHFDL